jgi:sodium/potassium/calcium exchanger 6
MSILWIYLIANEIVSLLETLGVIFNISQAVLGIILAWGNSVSDYVADVVVARKGLPEYVDRSILR